MECSTKRELAIDIETYSSVDIKLGAYAYSRAPDFDILLIAYKYSDDDEIKILDRATGIEDGTQEASDYEDFLQALIDPDIIKTAFNANFERTCLARKFGLYLSPKQWRCTQVIAVQLGLPRALADVGPALGIPEEEQKLKTGKALINYFCKPCKPTKANGGRTRNLPMHAPEKWELFKEYCIGDVKTEQAILSRLKDFRPDQSEQELWNLDQRINDRGVLLDIDLARRIVDFDERHTAQLLKEAAEITYLANPNSLPQLKPWLASKGVEVKSLTKAVVENLLAGDLPDDVRRVLEIRQSLGKTSVKKYQTMIDIAGADDRARGIMQFYGGHTGRWAGRSLQPQNLARNDMPDAELDAARDLIKAGEIESIEMLFGSPAHVFSQLVRTAFIPSEGCRFVVSDFSAIEARVVAWIAGEEWRLDVFRNDGDIYCESASRIYHVPVEKHGVNGHLRQRGKIAELALGYGGSVGAMLSMDTTGSVPEDEMRSIVQQWRAESPHIVRMWRLCQKAAVSVISGLRSRIRVSQLRGTEFSVQRVDGTPVLRITLPSGRPISYWDPKLMDSEYGPRITYMSQNQTTRKWERTETYGGKLTENIVQSVARDCLAEKMKHLDGMGYDVVFHVHDEIILDVLKADTHAAEIVDRVMGTPIDWAPDLPLKGGTYECDFYRKD